MKRIPALFVLVALSATPALAQDKPGKAETIAYIQEQCEGARGDSIFASTNVRIEGSTLYFMESRPFDPAPKYTGFWRTAIAVNLQNAQFSANPDLPVVDFRCDHDCVSREGYFVDRNGTRLEQAPPDYSRDFRSDPYTASGDRYFMYCRNKGRTVNAFVHLQSLLPRDDDPFAN